MITFPFSYVLIARNEAKTLPRLIKSIQYFMDNWGEVILVDTGSVDNTAQIARDLGCKVFEVWDRFKIKIDKEYADKINNHFIVDGEENIVNEWDSIFDFASARNYASSLASNSFCFSPDCDEVFTKFDYDKILEVINSWIEQLEYNFVFSHDQFGNPAISFMHCKAFDRRVLKWEWAVHEILVWNAKKQYLWEDIIKLEHFQNPETNRTGYLKWLAIDCFEHPNNDRNSHYLWREMRWTNRPKSAIKELERHVSMNWWAAERAQSLVYIWEACEILKRDGEALQRYFNAYLIWGTREPLIKLTEYFFKRQDWQKVVVFGESMLSIPQGSFYASDTENYTHKPHHLLYIAYWQLWNMEKSLEHFKKAFEYCPLNSKYLHDLRFYTRLPTVSIIVPTLGRPEWLEKLKKSIDALNYPKELIQVIIREDEPRIGVPKMVNRMYKESTGELIVFAANDVEFEPDSIINAVLEFDNLNTNLVSFNSWPVYEDDGNINEHFMIRRTCVDSILKGKIFDEDFHHCGCDNLLWSTVKKYSLDRWVVWCENAKIKHNHFTKTGVTDSIYDLAYSHAEEDRELLKIKLANI